MAALSDFYIKRHDTREPIQIICEKGDATVEDITGASVKFIMSTGVDAVSDKINAAATIVGAGTAGTVKYQWTGTDTDTTGNYLSEFQVTFTDGRVLTYPNTGYITIHVVADLGS